MKTENADFSQIFKHWKIEIYLLSPFILLTIFGTVINCGNRFETLFIGLGATATFAAVYVALFKESILLKIYPVRVTMKYFEEAAEQTSKTTSYYHIQIENETKRHFVKNPTLSIVQIRDEKGNGRPTSIRLPQGNSYWQADSPGFRVEMFFDLGQLDIDNGEPRFHLQVGHKRRNRPLYTIEKEQTKKVRLRFEADNLIDICEKDFSISVAKELNGENVRDLVTITSIRPKIEFR